MTNKNTTIPRRRFLAATSALGAAFFCSPSLETTVLAQADSKPEEKPLIDSAPVLQTPSERNISVTWAINAPATGWIEYGKTEKLGSTVATAHWGLLPYDNRYLTTRIDSLEPNTRYYYRTITAPIAFKNAYDIKQGEPVPSKIYSFKTPGPQGDTCTFAVMNDTHQNAATLKALTKRLEEIKPDYTIWNGDLLNDIYTDDQIVQYILRPGGRENSFGAESPVLFVSGNHDTRGPHARNLPKALVPWKHEAQIDCPFGRNFAVRSGPIAFISLDTGEDKPDDHPVFAGLAAFEPYRKAQQEWLERTLKRPEIASAPFIVTFCHIPLYDSRHNANGGDTLEGFAAYSKLGGQFWGPVLHEAGVQLLISAHTHRFRYDTPTENRTWAQLVGGGPQIERAVLIKGAIKDGKLNVIAEQIQNGTELGNWTYEPRKV